MGEYTSSVLRLSFGFFFVFMAFNTVQVRDTPPHTPAAGTTSRAP